MERRRIQLIAGTTYSVSLPKEWVKKNNLKEKSEIIFQEGNDRNLILSSHLSENQRYRDITLNIDEYIGNTEQILFSVYYLGFENINLFSKKEISKSSELKIRKALSNMSGTEIVYEDKNSIRIKVLLDKARIDLMQVIYRIMLIIESSIDSLMGTFSIEEISINENEIDRLYHLVSKIISLSLTDSAILLSSNIKYSSLIPSYFLITKKLENIADNFYHIAEHLNAKKMRLSIEDILQFTKAALDRCAKALIGKKDKVFEKTGAEKLKHVNQLISGIKDKVVLNYIEDIIRYIVDVEEEIVIISFYNKLFEGSF